MLHAALNLMIYVRDCLLEDTIYAIILKTWKIWKPTVEFIIYILVHMTRASFSSCIIQGRHVYQLCNSFVYIDLLFHSFALKLLLSFPRTLHPPKKLPLLVDYRCWFQSKYCSIDSKNKLVSLTSVSTFSESIFYLR